MVEAQSDFMRRARMCDARGEKGPPPPPLFRPVLPCTDYTSRDKLKVPFLRIISSGDRTLCWIWESVNWHHWDALC